ncbi:Uncharacterised protein [Citrobacter braakii]|uniref:hypothetical protein n=1 Tax=Citrobacter braakii TaxID=57706 RepID=UPI000E044CCB|nr:hypothetical protein [Citrobacter braakii]STH95963.1 Uncharacterised protein [Citrobacter braakii]
MKKLESQQLTFFYGTKTLKDIECDIVIDDENQWKKIEVLSKSTELITLQNIDVINIEIISKNFSGEIIKKIKINSATLHSFQMAIGRNTHIKFILHPKNVIITQTNSNLKSKRKVTVNYYINKSPAIAPYCRLKPSKNGSVKEEKKPPLKIKTSANLNIISDISFSYNLQGDNFESKRYQLLTVSFLKTKNVIEHINNFITPQIDNFLMLSSLLHDGRVSFNSWKADFYNTTVWFYKSQTVTADDISDDSFRELIERYDLVSFFNTALPIYESSPYKQSINNAIYALMMKKNSIVELAFLSYFQALESMILTFRRLNDTEFILSKKDFGRLRRIIEKTIKNEYPNEPELRSKIKTKLSELNRVSLKEAAEEFFAHFKIETDSIWPLFDDKTKGFTGLTSIRNILIHGDLLPASKFKSIIIALEHLRILLIRCVFSLIGWDCNNTKVSSGYLNKSHNFFSSELLNESIHDIHTHFIEKSSR